MMFSFLKRGKRVFYYVCNPYNNSWVAHKSEEEWEKKEIFKPKRIIKQFSLLCNNKWSLINLFWLFFQVCLNFNQRIYLLDFIFRPH